MSRAKGDAASGFRSKLHSLSESFSLENLDIRSAKSGQESLQLRPKLQSRAESLILESLVRRSECLHMSRAKGGAASGFRSKLHSLSESFSLETLDIRSAKSGQESLQGSCRIRT